MKAEEIVWAIVIFAIGFMVNKLSDTSNKHAKDHKEETKQNTIAIGDLKLVMLSIQIELKHLTQAFKEFSEKLDGLGKLKADVNTAFEQIKDIRLKKKLKNGHRPS